MSIWDAMNEDEKDSLKRSLFEKAQEQMNEMRDEIAVASDSSSDLAEIAEEIWNVHLDSYVSSEIEKIRMMNMSFSDEDEEDIRSQLKGSYTERFYKEVDNMVDAQPAAETGGRLEAAAVSTMTADEPDFGAGDTGVSGSSESPDDEGPEPDAAQDPYTSVYEATPAEDSFTGMDSAVDEETQADDNLSLDTGAAVVESAAVDAAEEKTEAAPKKAAKKKAAKKKSKKKAAKKKTVKKKAGKKVAAKKKAVKKKAKKKVVKKKAVKKKAKKKAVKKKAVKKKAKKKVVKKKAVKKKAKKKVVKKKAVKKKAKKKVVKKKAVKKKAKKKVVKKKAVKKKARKKAGRRG